MGVFQSANLHRKRLPYSRLNTMQSWGCMAIAQSSTSSPFCAKGCLSNAQGYKNCHYVDTDPVEASASKLLGAGVDENLFRFLFAAHFALGVRFSRLVSDCPGDGNLQTHTGGVATSPGAVATAPPCARSRFPGQTPAHSPRGHPAAWPEQYAGSEIKNRVGLCMKRGF